MDRFGGAVSSAVARRPRLGEPAALADLAKRVVASGTPGTLATLFAARGSTYRPLGSMMVSVPGMRAGGISGGCLEEYVARAGERATRTAPAAMLQFSTHADAGDEVPVLGCGGTIELLVERLTESHVALLEQFADASEHDDASLLACVVRRHGETLSAAHDWLPPARLCPPALDSRLVCLREDAVRERASVHRTISEDTEVLIQYVPPLTRLVIFGAGDDAKPLCTIGASLGWHVSVADRRARLATASRFSDARTVLAGDWDEVIDGLTFSPQTAVVLMTHDLDDDARLLSLLSRQPIAYLGALGPAHRRAWLADQASQLSIAPAPHGGATLRGPIGLDLGDRSAAGIAVSVAAEILAHLNGRSGRSLDAA